MKTTSKPIHYDSLEIRKVTNPRQKKFDYVVTYSKGKGDSHTVGINVASDGTVADYGDFAPGNYNKIRRLVNQTIETMAKDNYVEQIKLQKNYKNGVYVSVKAPNHELNLTHGYDNKSGQWYSENDNPDFAMVPTDHYIEKYEDLVVNLSCWMYGAQELKNYDQAKGSGRE